MDSQISLITLRPMSVIKHLPGVYKNMAEFLSCYFLNNRQNFLKKSIQNRRYIEKYEFQNIKNRLLDIYRDNLGFNLEDKVNFI